MEHQAPNESLRSSAAAGMAVIAAVIPPLVAVTLFGVCAVFNWFANDAFYYLTIAKNATWQLPTTFDGVMPTNGFHPVWQYILIGVVKLAGHDQERQLLAAFLACCIAWATGIGLAAYAIHRLTGSLFASLWLLPGIVWLMLKLLLLGPVEIGLLGYSPSAWTFINGMESSWSFLFGGALLALLATRATADAQRMWSDRFCVGIGMVAAACILARLDDVFLLPALWVYAFLYAKERWFRAILLMTAPAAIGIALYLASNLIQGLPLLPVSGATKAHFLLFLNLYVMVQTTIAPYLTGDWHGLYDYYAGDNAIRSLLVLIPFFFTSLLLFDWVKQRKNRSALEQSPAVIFYPLLVYVILKLLYNISYVSLGHQGYWYYALINLILNVILVVVFHNRFVRRSNSAGIVLAGIWVSIFIMCLSELRWKSGNTEAPNYVAWQHRNEVRTALLDIDPDIKLMDFSDGVIAYFLELPTISGTGLTSDADGYRFIKLGRRNEYIEYCLSRGYTVGAGGEAFFSWPMNKSYVVAELYKHERAGYIFQKMKVPATPQQQPRNPDYSMWKFLKRLLHQK